MLSMTWIREKFGTIVIGGIIGFIALVFTFYGIITPGASQAGRGTAGTVNGDPIPLSEFNREYARRVEFFKKLAGGKLTDEQLKNFHLKEGVFQELARRRLLIQAADRENMTASDEEVRDSIEKIKAFQKDGKFDLATYQQLLQANNYTPGSFEHSVRDDLSAQVWEPYFRGLVHVSEGEIRDQYLIAENKRDIKYVLLMPPKQEKGKPVDPTKENDALAEKILPLLSVSNAPDKKIDELLKSYGAKVKTTGLIPQTTTYLPGVGSVGDLIKDAFASKSPINPEDAGKAKKYAVPAGIVLALVVQAQKPDLAKLDAAEHDKLLEQIATRKERELYESWLKKIVAKASIKPNPDILRSEN